MLTEVEGEIRRIIYDMHPPVLDQMGLVVALKRFAATFQTSFGIECQIHIAGKAQRLNKATEVTIYRIVQAALHNVATHAQARHAKVHFDFGTAALQVVIEDYGIGFAPETVMRLPGEHLGLIGMKERAEGLKADSKVDSAPGKGSRILLRVPTAVYLET